MNGSSRRRFLANVGKGMLVASVGPHLAADLGLTSFGLAPALGDDARATLAFGDLEPLVGLMQDTPTDKLVPAVLERIKGGTDLRTIVAAAALANARTFGGQDYIGFHTFMALGPAYAMAQELPAEQRPLPILKVVYRNTNRIHAFGGRAAEVLHPVDAGDVPSSADGELLRGATRSGDFDQSERVFARIASGPVGEAYNHLQFAVDDEADVHRIVLAWRAYSTLDLTGQEHAHTLLRQSVRYCVKSEQQIKSRGYSGSPIRALLPKLLDQYKLAGRSLGTREADDAWMLAMSRLIVGATREQAADAVAAALAEGFSPGDIGQTLALAANELVLRDPGRREGDTSPDKPVGSVHGDSVGVHASDSANAWRNIAAVSNPRNTMASLIVGAFHTAGQVGRVNADLFPAPDQLEKVTAKEPQDLLRELDGAIQAKDQFRACAIVTRYGQLNQEPRPVFDLFLRYGTSEDGALHAEKYYRTVTEEFATLRPAFRWRQLAALARVTASEYGSPAPGYAQARELMKV